MGEFLVYALDSRPVFWRDFFKVISRYGVMPQSYESAMATEKFTLKVRNFWMNTPCCSSMGWKRTGEWMGRKMIRPFFLWEGVVGADEASGTCHLTCVRVGINLSRCHPPQNTNSSGEDFGLGRFFVFKKQVEGPHKVGPYSCKWGEPCSFFKMARK